MATLPRNTYWHYNVFRELGEIQPGTNSREYEYSYPVAGAGAL